MPLQSGLFTMKHKVWAAIVQIIVQNLLADADLFKMTKTYITQMSYRLYYPRLLFSVPRWNCTYATGNYPIWILKSPVVSGEVWACCLSPSLTTTTLQKNDSKATQDVYLSLPSRLQAILYYNGYSYVILATVRHFHINIYYFIIIYICYKRIFL